MFNSLVNKCIVFLYDTAFLAVTYVSVYYFFIKEKISNIKIKIFPVYIERVTEFCSDKYVDITYIFECKLKKNESILWSDLKNDNTNFIEVVINFFGRKRIFIIDENTEWYNISCSDNEIVYAYIELQNVCEKIEVTDLLKQFANISIDTLETKHFSRYIPGMNHKAHLVISRLLDDDEVILNLK